MKISKMSANWVLIFILAVFGILFMLGGFGTSGEKTESELEGRIRTLCENVNGVGEATVAVTLRENEICGVGVVCDGGEDPEVVRRLLSLISASCAVPTNRIYIADSKKEIPQS